MRKSEKLLVAFTLLITLLCFIIVTNSVYGFPGNENLTAAVVDDFRVNGNQYVVWNITVTNNATSWVNLTFAYGSTIRGPYNITLSAGASAISNHTAPTSSANYTVQITSQGAIQNQTYVGFIVDYYNIDMGALYTEVEATFNTLLYANGSSIIDGHTLGDGDTLVINGETFTWNSFMNRFEAVVSQTTPQIITYDTLTTLNEATYGITTGNISTPVTITWTTQSLNLIMPFLRTGDWPGVILQINFILLGETIFWTLLMTGISMAIYNYSGTELTIMSWVIGWSIFSPVIHGEAVTISLIMIALAGGIYIARFFLDRRTSV